MSDKREQWGSSFGFILAAAGSAVGLGNLWRFPYVAWENNGGAWVLLYLICIAAVGLPVMMCEILIGRTAQKSTVPAFEKLGGPLWGALGWLGVSCGGFILAFYAVIAGWSISSFVNCIGWSINGYQDQDFAAFTANGPLQLGLSFLFSLITAVIVYRGVSGGIEKATRILMPVLIFILLLLVVNSFTLDGFGEAIAYLFAPRFSGLSKMGVLEALGQAFFTLSLGMGAMITYGSYMSRKESIGRAALSITALDTLIALIATIIMFTILFTFPQIQGQISADSGNMLFVVIPKMFYTQMPLGSILAPIFFVLVGFAALSSTISMLEVVTALLIDKIGIPRHKATFGAAVGIYAVTVLTALSLGAVPALTNLQFAGKNGLLAILGHVTSNWVLPVGGFLISVFVGWVLDQKLVSTELGMDERPGLFKLFQIATRIVAPAIILYVAYSLNFG
ncbi:MAG: sodium-dependent transporter [Acidobacteriota bacterium]|nr:sodium-dependent transporter [Acidobacteriota bacterium]